MACHCKYSCLDINEYKWWWQAICFMEADINNSTYLCLFAWSDFFFTSDIFWSKVSYIRNTLLILREKYLPKFSYYSHGHLGSHFFIFSGTSLCEAGCTQETSFLLIEPIKSSGLIASVRCLGLWWDRTQMASPMQAHSLVDTME